MNELSMNIYEIWTQTNPHFPFNFHRCAFLPMNYILVSVFCGVRWPLVYLANDWGPKCNSLAISTSEELFPFNTKHKIKFTLTLKKKKKVKEMFEDVNIQRWFTCRLRRIRLKLNYGEQGHTGAHSSSDGGSHYLQVWGGQSKHTHRGPADTFKSDSHTRWREDTH